MLCICVAGMSFGVLSQSFDGFVQLAFFQQNLAALKHSLWIRVESKEMPEGFPILANAINLRVIRPKLQNFRKITQSRLSPA